MMDGYIYVLENPTISEYVKVGFSYNVDKTLNDVNLSADFPQPFHKAITYKIDIELSNKEVINLFLLLQPSLIKDEFALKNFYLKISLDDIYILLCYFAEISNTKDNIWYLYNKKLVNQTDFGTHNNPDDTDETNFFNGHHDYYLLSSYSNNFEKTNPIKLFMNNEEFDVISWLDMCYQICYELYSLNEDALGQVLDIKNPLIGRDIGNGQYKYDKSYKPLFDNYYILCAGISNVQNILSYISQIVSNFDKIVNSNFINNIKFEIL